MVKFAEGQPESIVQDIENMVRTHVEKVIKKVFVYPIVNFSWLQAYYRCPYM